MTANENATSQLITEDDVLAFYDEKNYRKVRQRQSVLWKLYALRPEDVWALIKRQRGCCPICLGWLTLEAGLSVGIAIDHEGPEGEGRVRGVLHHSCNTNVLGHLEKAYRDLPDGRKPKQMAHEYLTNPPAKDIKVGDSNLYDDKIEDRWKRGRPGRFCQREGCEKELPATTPLNTKYCDPKCKHKAARASERARSLEILPDRECLECGDPIDDDAHLKQKYCDLKCRRDARNARRRKKN